MTELVELSSENYMKGEFEKFSKNLTKNWNYKKQLSPFISNKSIDYYFKKAIYSGASGGKLLGAGGGGFLCFYVRKKFQKQVIKSLNKLIYIPIDFENKGTQIINIKNLNSEQ